MKVMVTGAAGKVGSMLVKDLREHGAHVVGFDAAAQPDGLDCAWVRGELSDADALGTALSGCDAAAHLAAIPKHVDGLEVETCRANILGTVNLLDQAAHQGVRRVAVASSICAAGLITSVGARRPKTLPVTEEFDGGADDMYGMSKRFGETAAEAYGRRYGLTVVSLRIASVSFPGNEEYADFMSSVFAAESDGSELMRDIRWQYVDVRDVTQAFRLALTHPEARGVYNVGAGDTPGSDWTVWHPQSFPDVAAASVASSLLDRPAAALWSIDRISRELGYSPKHGWREHGTIAEGVESCKSRLGAASGASR